MSRVVVITKENYDYSRAMNEWLENFYRATGRKLEVINPDTETSFCETYDIVEYPSIIALDDNGGILALWKGMPLPLRDEVLYFLL